MARTDKFAGTTVLITGASRGIGRASACYFHQNGANLVLAARSKAALDELVSEIQTDGGHAVAVACDVGNAQDVQRAVDAASVFGGVDILVNNAGLIDPIARIDESDPEAWSQIVDVNLKGPYYATRAVLSGMVEKGSGTIINISSGAATGALEGWSHYCATKAGLLSLTKCSDKEYRDLGVRVIGLSPGTVATEMQVQIKASGINPVSQLDPDAHISPDWVAKAIGYLCGEGGDPYLGTDFSMKTNEGRKALGLPLIS